jgi:hypothetical protein
MNRTHSTINDNLKSTKTIVKRDFQGHLVMPIDKNFKCYLDQQSIWNEVKTQRTLDKKALQEREL